MTSSSKDGREACLAVDCGLEDLLLWLDSTLGDALSGTRLDLFGSRSSAVASLWFLRPLSRVPASTARGPLMSRTEGRFLPSVGMVSGFQIRPLGR